MQPLQTGNMQKEELYEPIENPDKLNNKTVEALKKVTEAHPYFQAAWMLYLKNLQQTSHSDFKNGLKMAAIKIPSRKKLYRFLYSKPGSLTSDYYFAQTEGEKPEVKESEVTDSLIDKFLSSEPSPIRAERTEEEKEEQAGENEVLQKSVSETDDIVSEPLAMIYFEQKKYDKALDAFKKLSLKYPEKSVYFATRIEEIEKLKNI